MGSRLGLGLELGLGFMSAMSAFMKMRLCCEASVMKSGSCCLGLG